MAASMRRVRSITMGSRFEAIVFAILQLVFVTVCSLFYLLYPTMGLSAEQIIRPLSWLFLTMCLWMIGTWWRVQGTIFDPYILFLLAAIMFNGGHVLLETLGMNSPAMLRGEFSDQHLVTTIVFVTSGLAVFHAGALLAGLFRAKRSIPAVVSRRDPLMMRAMWVVGTVLLIVSLPVWALEKIGDIRTVLSGGYMALYQQSAGGAASGIGLLSNFFIPGSMFLLIGSKDRSVGRWFGIGVILLNAVVEFFLGSRTNAMWPLLGLIWAYHRSIRALPRTLLVAGALLVLIVIFPMVKAFRGITGSARTSIDALVGAYASVDNPLVSIVSEMGYSMVTVAHTLQLVPEVRPYDLGAGYFFATTTIIPSVMGDLHPAVARGTAAHWLIENVAPETAQVGGGLGFSFLAEGYYNFGWIGGLIALFVIGAMMSTFFVRSAYSGTPLGIATSAIALSFLTYYARGESASIIRSLVWYTAIPALLVPTVKTTISAMIARGDRETGETVRRRGTRISPTLGG